MVNNVNAKSHEILLANSDVFYKTIIDQSANLILVTDERGSIVYVNERFKQVSKYSDNELIGNHTRILKSGAQSYDFYKKLWETISEGNVFRGQFKNKAKDGSYYWLSTTITPLLDSFGAIKYYLSVSENITYQKIVDERFIFTTNFYKLLLKHLPHTGILISSNEDIIQLAEGEVISLITIKNKVNSGQSTSGFLKESGLDELNKYISQVFNYNKTITVEISLQHISLRIQLIPILTEKEQPTSVLLLFHDVSQYVKILKESQTNQKRLETLFFHAGAGIAIIDTDGLVIKSNETWNILSSFSEKAQFRNIKELVYKNDYLSLAQQMIDLEKGKIKSFRTELRFNGISTEFSWIDLSMASMYDEIENNMLFIVIAIDIDEVKNAQAKLIAREGKLKEINKNKDKLFNILSHDLRNPFNSILGFSEFISLEYEKLSQLQLKQYIDIIYTTAENTFSLLENLLEWSRSQLGKTEWSPKTSSIFEIVEVVNDQLRPMADKKEIKIINNIPKSIKAFFDQNMLNIVVRNLVTNAVKFSYRGSEVITNAVEDIVNKVVIVSVEDKGKGVSKSKIKKLFNGGSIDSDVGTEKEHGSGLGLMLCNDFVKQNKGKIWVESTEGVGSIFYFTIPVKT